MNIVFFGSSDFAVPSLRALITGGYTVSCVVTQPDRQKGRGLHWEPTAIKYKAKELKLKIYQPQQVNTEETIRFLQGLNPDLFVVVSYGQILSKEVLEIPKILSINIHASLLPKYRGAAPINWAIINGETNTGITIIKMTKDVDAGQIILQKSIEILAQDNAVTLAEKLSSAGADLSLVSLKLIEGSNYTLKPQDKDKVTFAPKIRKEDGLIHWNKPAWDICNLIRGCLDWPGAFTYYKGKLLKVYKTVVTRSPGHQVTRSPGEIIDVSKKGIIVAAGEGGLIIEELQLEGKRKMKVEEFIAGHKIKAGEKLG